jgi:phage gp29-like protein
LLSLDYQLEIKDINYLENIDIHNLMSTVLESLFYGFQAFEIIWDWNGAYYPKAIIPLPQEIFRKEANKDLKIIINGFQQDVNKDKVILAINERSFISPLGVSLLEKCYWSAKFKNTGMRYWIDYLERFGMPMVMAKMNRNSTDSEMEKLLNDLHNMAGNNILVAPKDLDIEYRESQRQEAVEIFATMIDLCNAEISKTILSQTLTTEIKQASLAAAETHLKVRKEIIESDARLVTYFMNELIGLINKVNKQDSGMRFQIMINDEDKKERLERDIALSKIGVKFSKQYWIKQYQYLEDDLE